jgi:hypothetical protein
MPAPRPIMAVVRAQHLRRTWPRHPQGLRQSCAAASKAWTGCCSTWPPRCCRPSPPTPSTSGPAAVLSYLSRYTHRVAIANSQLMLRCLEQPPVAVAAVSSLEACATPALSSGRIDTRIRSPGRYPATLNCCCRWRPALELTVSAALLPIRFVGGHVPSDRYRRHCRHR